MRLNTLKRRLLQPALGRRVIRPCYAHHHLLRAARQFSIKTKELDIDEIKPHFEQSAEAKKRLNRHQEEIGLRGDEDKRRKEGDREGANVKMPNLETLRHLVHFPDPKKFRRGIYLKSKPEGSLGMLLFTVVGAFTGPVAGIALFKLLANIKLFWWVRPVLFCVMSGVTAGTLSLLLQSRNIVFSHTRPEIRELSIEKDEDGAPLLKLLLSSTFGFVKKRVWNMTLKEDGKTPDPFIEIDKETGKAFVRTPDGEFAIPDQAEVLQPEGLLNIMSPQSIQDSMGSLKPVRLQEGCYAPVAKYDDLRWNPRGVLRVAPYGSSTAGIEYLFIGSRGTLYGLRNQCMRLGKKLHDGSYTELHGGRCTLRCTQCPEQEHMELTNTLDWKVDKETGMVLMKLDRGVLENMMPAPGCKFEGFLEFFKTNNFRLAHPVKPTKASDIFVVGEFTEHGPFEHTFMGGLNHYKYYKQRDPRTAS